MKLIRTNPAGLTQIADFDEWLRHPFAGLPALGSLFDFGARGERNTTARLATDIYEDASHYYARFEVPGVKKEDVKLELVDRLLTVAVEKRTKVGETEQSYSLTRSVSVPDSVASENIGAKLEDGVLTVTLPKEESRKPRTIDIA